MMEEKKGERNWQERLLAWFDNHKRDLPWREDKPRNPYHVWISEIMLQQTRTEAVKPYFNSWMERFPTISALARAKESEVLHQWQGLGYYSRARNIHKAAMEMAETYGGRLPDRKEDILSLPGIGSYTAGAILSMAYGKREGAIDGNVLRVYARLYQVEEDILKSRGRKKIEALVNETLPDRAGDFNEALMDLARKSAYRRIPAAASALWRKTAQPLGMEKKRNCPSARRKSRRKKNRRPAASGSGRERYFSTKGRPGACWLPCGNFPWPLEKRKGKPEKGWNSFSLEKQKISSGNINMFSPIASGI